MGGRALSVKTRRYQRDEYFALQQEVREAYIEYIGEYPYEVKAYRSKESFGDLDIVLSAAVDREKVEKFILDHLKSKQLVKNSDVWSFEYKEFQVDFVFSHVPGWTCDWMDYNDCSNLVGRVAYKFGLKFGQHGMFLPVKPVRDGDHKIGEIFVSIDIQECLEFLGFASDRHFDGFDTLEEIYEFVSTSDYFNPEIYLLENRNAKARMRDAKRPTYTGFLKYCESLPPRDYYKFAPDKAMYLKQIFREFPHVKTEYEKLMTKYAEDKALKEKFNGDLVRAWTGLEGKELGAFMSYLRSKTWFASMVETEDNDTIEKIVRTLFDWK